jgi:acyl-coenzyme A thioesterase PaaI-like protein
VPATKKKKNYCFACGLDNREGLRLVFQYDPKTISASTPVRIDPKYQGATGFAHGGIIATLLDEAMAKVNGLGGILAVTLNLSISYRKMVPIREELLLSGRRVRKRGRKLYLRSELRKGSELLADARGLFLVVRPESLTASASPTNE